MRIPIHQPFGAIDQALFVQFDKDLGDSAHHLVIGRAIAHGKAQPRPVARGAETLQLAVDGAARFLFPLPDFLQKGVTAHGTAIGTVFGGQFALDHHLCRDTGMIGARLPQHIATPHPLETAQNILQSIVERMAHMQRAGHIGWRDHDCIRLGALAIRTPCLEGLLSVPQAADTAFNACGIKGLFHHDQLILSGPIHSRPKPQTSIQA